jgi:hypothetical protein
LAFVNSRSGHHIADCQVENLSREGAKLRVLDPALVPDHFVLVRPTAGSVPCRVVWRELRHLGVQFSD